MRTYRNIDVELFDHVQTATHDVFRARVADSDVGEQRIAHADRVELPLQVRGAVDALRRRELDRMGTILLGSQLGDALLPDGVRRLWSAALARLGDDEGLRLRIRCDTYGLAELPWEYAHVTHPDLAGERSGPEGFLVLNRRISLARYEPQEGTHTSLGAGVGVIRLVALLASPADPRFAALDVEAERRNIEAALAGLSGVRAEFVDDATADSLLGALATPAQVFHFAGHGVFTGAPGSRYGSQEGESAVVLVGDDGAARLVPAAQLAMMLAGRGVRLAVLTACDVGQRDATNSWSGVVTALTRVGIPAVVGMQFPVRDSAAVAFSRAFYRALAAGASVDGAMADGRLAVVARCGDASRDWGVPVLYLRAEEGVLFPRGEGSAVSGGATTPPPPPPGGATASAATHAATPAATHAATPAATHAATPAPTSPATHPTAPAAGSGGAASSGPVNRRALREAIVGSFTTEDLMVLCEDIEAALEADGIALQVNLDMVGGSSKAVQVLRLIEYLEHRGHLPYLVATVQEHRPGLV